MKTIREQAARAFYETDLTLNDDTSVTKVIDLLEKFGMEIAEQYYLSGKTDMILGKPKDRLFDKKTNKANHSV